MTDQSPLTDLGADEQPTGGPAAVNADAAPGTGTPPLDLDRIERDLAGVEDALRRLDEGSYWTDEVTGEPIPDDALAADPVTRRAR